MYTLYADTCTYRNLLSCVSYNYCYRKVMENLKISVITKGTNSIWKNMCILETVKNIITLELQAVDKLDMYITELNNTLDIIEESTKEAVKENYVCAENHHLVLKVTEQISFIRNFRKSKIRCIEICREIEEKINAQITQIIED